ncbi:hypothetical protein Acr_08g0017420 [Actinidia rufa]|uniref:DUF4005 domain-containing protein n=1 Tax=Actinidia rufa TaxID=165716 RepID=A0A7J0F4L1_9ERIC|nr:hypothetical protein Acr_08g0017420 [Actinidia rufa]
MAAEKELMNTDQSSVKIASLSTAGGGEITKSYARHIINLDKPSPTPKQNPTRPSPHKSPSTPPSSKVVRKLKPTSSVGSVLSHDDDARSFLSVRSDMNRRHSIAGSSVRDDVSLASSPAVPGYMAVTKSAKAKSRVQSPLGLENETPEKEPSGSVKKRLSFPASPARPRRHSGPPKVEFIFGWTIEENKLVGLENEVDEEKNKISKIVATAAAAEAAVAAAQAAAEVVRLTSVTQFTGKSKEEVAAIKIQTEFRGYRARRAFRALRGLVRLKSLVQGQSVKRQTANALKCMQTLSRVQSQIQSRRIRMSEENQALQRQLLQNRAKELARSGRTGMTVYSRKNRLKSKLTWQQTWKKSTRSATLMFMAPNNPHWGWSWLERWMAAEKELMNTDQSSVKIASLSTAGGGEITKSYARHIINLDKPSPTPKQNPTRPSPHKSPSTPPSSKVVRKLKPTSSVGSVLSHDDDARSFLSVRSDMNRRHSIAGSSVRDDVSLASSPAVPGYMAVTKSAKAKSRVQSPLGLENETPEKEPSGSVKKRLSFPASPARPRRHSGPPKVEL